MQNPELVSAQQTAIAEMVGAGMDWQQIIKIVSMVGRFFPLPNFKIRTDVEAWLKSVEPAVADVIEMIAGTQNLVGAPPVDRRATKEELDALVDEAKNVGIDPITISIIMQLAQVLLPVAIEWLKKLIARRKANRA